MLFLKYLTLNGTNSEPWRMAYLPHTMHRFPCLSRLQARCNLKGIVRKRDVPDARDLLRMEQAQGALMKQVVSILWVHSYPAVDFWDDTNRTNHKSLADRTEISLLPQGQRPLNAATTHKARFEQV